MKNTACFFGHRTINETEELKAKLIEIIEKLIVYEKVDTFLFGSKSRFNSLCLELVTEIKEKYPHIKRIYVRAEYPDINEQYINYLLESYEDTYYPEHIRSSGRAAYVERNYEMINKSQFCIVYYDEPNVPTTRKSGTKIALDYAVKQGKQITVLPTISYWKDGWIKCFLTKTFITKILNLFILNITEKKKRIFGMNNPQLMSGCLVVMIKLLLSKAMCERVLLRNL